ncbi:FG-GAP repeat domain-containing protein, partial [Candidatus Aenigmatarchaeota archaeon]
NMTLNNVPDGTYEVWIYGIDTDTAGSGINISVDGIAWYDPPYTNKWTWQAALNTSSVNRKINLLFKANEAPLMSYVGFDRIKLRPIYVREYTTNFTLDLPVGEYIWNARGFDNNSFSNFADDNFSLSIGNASLVTYHEEDEIINQRVEFFANYTNKTGGNLIHSPRLKWTSGDIGSVASVRIYDIYNDGIKNKTMAGESGDVFGLNTTGGNLTGFPANEPTSTVYDIKMMDADSDGIEDEIAIVESIGRVRVFDNDGTERWNSNDGGTSYSMETIDYNDNGIREHVVFGSYGSNISSYDENGTEVWTRYLAELGNEYPYEMEVCDCDRDGAEDDIAVIFRTGFVYTFNEAGETIWKTDDIGQWIYALEVGDVSHNDYNDDVIVPVEGSVYVFEYQGSMNETLTTSDAITSSIVYGNRTHEIEVLDYDNDGYIDDFVLADSDIVSGTNASLRMFNNDSITQWEINFSKAGGNSGSSHTLLAADLDGDGEEEILFTDTTSTDTIFAVNKTGGYLWSIALNTGNIGTLVSEQGGFYAEQYDNDTVPELAVAGLLGTAYLLETTPCRISFDNGTTWKSMWFNTTHNNYQYNKSFSSSGNYTYNISCGAPLTGFHEINTSSTVTIFSKAVAVDFSANLSTITWNVTYIPQTNFSAEGNNGTGPTLYWVNISTIGTDADLHIKADGNLTTGTANISIDNQKYSYNITNSSVPSDSTTSLTDAYVLLVENIDDSTLTYLKFFLNVSGNQEPGTYQNNVTIIATQTGVPP